MEFKSSINSLPACLLFGILALTCSPAGALQEPAISAQDVLVVVGADGAEEYAGQFSEWARNWKEAAAHTRFSMVGTDLSETADRDQLQNLLTQLQAGTAGDELWLVLIGHGTFDGKRAKFNLRGQDIEAAELATWLKPLNQRVIVINCASCSSPFINALSGRNRIIVTSTKDGAQYNFSRFGKYISDAINDPATDLDKDGQTSLLEAFCEASQSVQGYYDQENRLATEHALIDDNGDGLGTPADWFDGVRANRSPKQGIADGLAANQVFLQRSGAEAELSAGQRTKRDELETRLEKLRVGKAQMTEEQYLFEIEPVLIELAELYRSK